MKLLNHTSKAVSILYNREELVLIAESSGVYQDTSGNEAEVHGTGKKHILICCVFLGFFCRWWMVGGFVVCFCLFTLMIQCILFIVGLLVLVVVGVDGSNSGSCCSCIVIVVVAPAAEVVVVVVEGRKEVFYFTMLSTHFIYGYMASDIW